MIAIALLVVAFFIGAVPFSYLLGRLRGIDLREVGSGNIGATNLARAAGYWPGIVGLLLDAFKGWAAVVLTAWIGAALPEEMWAPTTALAGLMAILGHTFTPFMKFRGGKGVATGAGVFLALAPRAFLAAFVVFLVVTAVSRVVSLGSVVAALVLPVAAHLFGADRSVTLSAVIVAALVLYRHRSNLARLARGRENRLERPR